MPDELPAEIGPSDGVENVSGIGGSRGQTLRENGYRTVEDLQGASLQDLDTVLPSNVARSVKETVGNAAKPVTSIAQAKEEAQKKAGAKAKMVRVNGRQQAKVLEKEFEQHVAGATIEIHKG